LIALDMTAALNALRKAERVGEEELGKIRSAISSLVGGKRRGRPAGGKNRATSERKDLGRPKGLKMSAAASKRISDAQKARWAKQKAGDRKK
jgi:hypothetical protein